MMTLLRMRPFRLLLLALSVCLARGVTPGQTYAPPVDFQLPQPYPVVSPAAPNSIMNSPSILPAPTYDPNFDSSQLPAPYNGQPFTGYAPAQTAQAPAGAVAAPAIDPALPANLNNAVPIDSVPIDGGVVAEAVEEVIEEGPGDPGPWYTPGYWFGPWWDGSFEVGINGSSGNSDSLSLRTGFELKRETERTIWDIDLTYSKVETNQTETQHNALLFSNWDFKLKNPRWTWFTKLQLEYDEFKNFDLRVALNTGMGYQLVDTESTKFRPRFGAGVSREIGGVDDDFAPEAVFGFDFSHQFTERQKFKAVFDFYPRWDDFSDHRWVLDAGWEVVLDKESNLSLKVGVIDRYDSTPNGAESNDINYSLLLLWAI